MNQYGYQIKFGHKLTDAIKWIMGINAGIFLLHMILSAFMYKHAVLNPFLGLVPAMISHKFWLWQFFTYLFVHNEFFHLFFNMFALWIFGCELESLWGKKRFLFYYFLTGVSAGLITYIFSFNRLIPTIGASGAIYGILIAYGLIYPNRKILLFFIYPIKAIYLALLYMGIEFFLSFSYSRDGISHITHFGGMIVGFVYLVMSNQVSFLRITDSIKNKLKGRMFKKYTTPRERIDYILKKVNREGLHSLTTEEREFLMQFKHDELYHDDDDDVTIH